jgi:hypothetical protein
MQHVAPVEGTEEETFKMHYNVHFSSHHNSAPFVTTTLTFTGHWTHGHICISVHRIFPCRSVYSTDLVNAEPACASSDSTRTHHCMTTD